MRKLNIKGCGKVKYQTVLRLTLRVSALLSINFVLKLDVLSFERVGGGIFQIADIVPSIVNELICQVGQQ